eukprot:TRINITY_DN50925_c0_g1_i1.p1 TRINITY_DN50925_c0_g1~~TRINITY_DN50925_c0_g1_i1.p1  ORF type:complete len:681 (-),score=147.83 TRINITY_DN50925_c0_g1_i1:182-2224(-)
MGFDTAGGGFGDFGDVRSGDGFDAFGSAAFGGNSFGEQQHAFAAGNAGGCGASGGNDAWAGGDLFGADGFASGGGFSNGATGGMGEEHVPAARASGSALLTMPSEQEAMTLAKSFEQAVGVDGFVSAEEGKQRLQKTRLPDQMLKNIWDLSDLDRDYRLSFREFVCAMHLATHASNGQPLPVEVRPEQQATFAQSVERLAVGKKGKHSADGDVARTSEWGTGHIAGSDGGGICGAACASSAHWKDVPPTSGDLVVGENTGLAQLASVFEDVARIDHGGELRRLSADVVAERREFEEQLSRRRAVEKQLSESRAHLDRLRESRRRVEGECAASQRHIAHLQDEILFVNEELRDAEEDLALLRESSDIPSGDSKARRGPAPYGSAEDERRDVLSKVRAERELLQRDQKSIEELRARLEEVFKKKLEAQVLQQSLLEKQRQTEQDRGLMLTAIEAERGKLSAMRAERIRLWEERSRLERETTDLAQERWLAEHQSGPRRDQLASGRASGTPVNPSEAVSGSFRSAPSDPHQRVKGVRRDERPPPAVIHGTAPPNEWCGSRAGDAPLSVSGGVGDACSYGASRDGRFADDAHRTGAEATSTNWHGGLSGPPRGGFGDRSEGRFGVGNGGGGGGFGNPRADNRGVRDELGDGRGRHAGGGGGHSASDVSFGVDSAQSHRTPIFGA